MLCAIILLPIRGYIFYELGLTRLAGSSLPFELGGPLLRPFTQWSRQHGMQTVGVLNLPGAVFQLPFILREDWIPITDRQVWNAITLPILALVFWWLAGRGADALVASRGRRLLPRIGWVETVIGSLITAAGATIVIGVEFFSGTDRADLQGLAAAAGMWTLLAGLTVAARITQWRVRKKLATNLQV